MKLSPKARQAVGDILATIVLLGVFLFIIAAVGLAAG